MSPTIDVTCESKLRDLDLERRDSRTVVAVILGGGDGTCLFPLTKCRAKPTVPIGGAYMLIDVPMSYCINSKINKMYIFTQFNLASLNGHITRAYYPGNGVIFGDDYVEVLVATQTPGEAGNQGITYAKWTIWTLFKRGGTEQFQSYSVSSPHSVDALKD